MGRYAVQEGHDRARASELLGPLQEGREHVMQHLARLRLIAEQLPGPPQHGWAVALIQAIERRQRHEGQLPSTPPIEGSRVERCQRQWANTLANGGLTLAESQRG